MYNKPKVTLNIADNRIDQAGYVRRWYPSTKELWPEMVSQNIFAWPGTKLVTLTPVYEPNPAEIALAQWTCEGTRATFDTVTGLFGSSGPIIRQTNPTAQNITVTSTFTPQDNQPAYVDFWFAETFDKTWLASLRFCRNYGLYLLYNGTIQVWTNNAAPGETDDWQFVTSFKALDGVTNKHLRLAIYPSAHQELVLLANGQEPVVLLDSDPIVTQDAEGIVYRTIAQAWPVVLSVSSGSFHFSYRYMRHELTGAMAFPVTRLPWEYAGAYALQYGQGRNRAGYTSTVTGGLYVPDSVVGATGWTAITSPPAAAFQTFRMGAQLTTTDPLFTPELNWTELRIAPTSKVHTGSPYTVTENGRLLSVTAAAELRGRREAKLAFSNIDGGFSAFWSRLRMCASIEDADTLATLWKGYLTKTDAPYEQSGDNRLEFSGSDTLTKLEVPLSDAYIGDGRAHTDFVTELFKCAGLAPADYSVAADSLGLILPEALGEEEPLFQARDGKTIKEMVEYICKVWSGWELYADGAGVIHYAPIDTTAAATVSLLGYHTSSPGYLLFHNMRTSRDESNFYNVIVVIGADAAMRPLMAYYYDAASVGDVTSTRYLGIEKPLIVVDSNLRTLQQVETALGYIVAEHGQPLEEAEADTEWLEALDVGSIVTVAGYGETVGETFTLYRWQVTSLVRKWEPEAAMNLRLKKVGL